MIELQSKHEVVTGEVVPDADILAGADSDPATGGPAGATTAGAATAGTVPGAGTPAGKYDAGAAAAASAPAARTAAQAGPTHHLQGAAIAALLEEADAAELSLHRPAPAGVSTGSRDFAELLEQLGTGLRTPTDPPAAAPAAAAGAAAGGFGSPGHPVAVGSPEQPAAVGSPVHPAVFAPGSAEGVPAPAPLTGVGDLVLLIGLGEDAMDTALAMSMASGGADVRTAGELAAYGHLHVDGRQSATAARAHAVVTERTVLVAFGLGKARNALARVPSVAALSADQVWVVVDAGRKHEDTARWVGVLSAQLNVTAVAVVGASETGSPESVNGLGLPVGWIDGRPAGPEPTWQNRRESYDAPRAEG
jgi:hypothetical protein